MTRLTELMLRYPQAGYAHSAITVIDAKGAQRQVRHLARGTGFQEGERALHASLSGYRTAANVLMFRKTALEQIRFLEGPPRLLRRLRSVHTAGGRRMGKRLHRRAARPLSGLVGRRRGPHSS